MAGTRDHPFEDLSNTVAWMQLGKIREYWVEIRTTGTCGSKEVDQITTSVRGEGEGVAASQPRAMTMSMPGPVNTSSADPGQDIERPEADWSCASL